MEKKISKAVSNGIVWALTGRSMADVSKSEELKVQEPEPSVEARELKKQTRMMAEEKASIGFSAGFLFGLILAVTAFPFFPWLPWPAYLAAPFILGYLCRRSEYKRLMSD